jgi:CDP-glucose 4,6-dehydratase
VTGHTGFKGGWLALWLRELQAEVTGFGLPPDSSPNLFEAAAIEKDVCHIEGDVRDRSALGRVFRASTPEIVFHLAAQPLVTESYRDPLATITTNVMGVVNVLEEVRAMDRSCAVVLVTSDKCYENQEWKGGYRETDRLGGHDPYSASKAAAEILIESYRRSYFAPQSLGAHGVAVASARAGNVIGGGDWAKDRLVPDCVRALSSANVVRVRRPDAVRPWQHVLEPLSGYLSLGVSLLSDEAPRFCEAWNFGPETESNWSVRGLVEAFLSRWGSGEWEVASEGAPQETTWLSLSIEKTRSKLGWSPRWEMDRAVIETVRWYRAFYDGEDVRELCKEQIAAYEEGD